jgi:hypothetical protein
MVMVGKAYHGTDRPFNPPHGPISLPSSKL